MTHNKPLEPFSLCNSLVEIQYVGVLSVAVTKPFQRLNLNAAQLPIGSGAARQQPVKFNGYPPQPRPSEAQELSPQSPAPLPCRLLLFALQLVYWKLE